MQLNRIDTVLIKSLYLFAVLIVIVQVLGIRSLISPLFYMTFLFVIAAWVSSARVMKQNDYLALIIIVLAVLNIFINAIITNSSLSFSYVNKSIFFASTIILFVVADKMRIDRNTERWITFWMTITTAVIIVGYLLFHDRMYVLNNRVSQYLTFGFTNPNLTGMVLVCLLIYQFAAFFRTKSVMIQIVHAVFAVVLVYFLFLTQARNSFLAAAVFLLLAIAARFIRFDWDETMHPVIATAVSWWPLVFAWIYLRIVNSRWLLRLLSVFISEGKLLDSRVRIWSRAFDTYRENPLFGAYSQISGGTGTSQMHNSHVDILCSYGPVVLVLVCWLLTRVLRGCRITSYTKALYLMGVICVIFLGMGEAALFSGGLSMYIIAIGLLFMANAEEQPPEASLDDVK